MLSVRRFSASPHLPLTAYHPIPNLRNPYSTVPAAKFQNFEGVELILRIVLGQEDIKIKSVRIQEPLKNLQGRSAILDVHAIDITDKEFDVEIQRKDAEAGTKSTVHNSSLLDAHILKYGDDTVGIPDSYVIFITENDIIYEALAKKARYFKQYEKGVPVTCKIMEDMRNEAELKKAKK